MQSEETVMVCYRELVSVTWVRSFGYMPSVFSCVLDVHRSMREFKFLYSWKGKANLDWNPDVFMNYKLGGGKDSTIKAAHLKIHL